MGDATEVGRERETEREREREKKKKKMGGSGCRQGNTIPDVMAHYHPI